MLPKSLTPPLPRWIKILLAVVPLSGVVAGVARTANQVETKAHAESTFVRKDTFAIHLAGEALQYRTDSLERAHDRDEELRMLFGLDSDSRCHRGFSRYCR